MRRLGRVLRLREGTEAEYERYHHNVWPEVLAACAKIGIRNYTIFRYERWLFAYFELPDDCVWDEAVQNLADCQVCRRWETIMRSLQEPLPESQGEIWWVPMREVFHL